MDRQTRRMLLANPIKIDDKVEVISTQEHLLKFHEQICREAREIMKAKNTDYSDGIDPFMNFRDFGQFGIGVRMGDKWKRFRNFLTSPNKKLAVSESIRDTLLDLINYAILYLAYEKGEDKAA